MVSAVVLIAGSLSAQSSISGFVYDLATGEPLPYATVVIMGSEVGSTTGLEGQFSISAFVNEGDSLRASYVGYESLSILLGVALTNLDLRLAPSANLLDEVTIRPISPEDLLRRVKQKTAINNTETAFNTNSYYQEWIRENGALIDHQEAVFRSWFESYQLNAKQAHQVALHRREDTEQLEFMRKKAEKEKRQYLKKHPEKAEEFEDGKVLLTSFGGPAGILNLNTNNNSLTFLDTTLQNKFNYNYEIDTRYEGRSIIVISYEAKRSIDNLKQRGKVFIDAQSEAIVAVEEEGDVTIPLLVRPILFAMGLSIKNPRYVMRMKFREINGRWYPQYTHWQATFSLKKKHLFDENEKGDFSIRQELNIEEIQVEGIQIIDPSKEFDVNEKMSEQVHPFPSLGWPQ